MSIELLAAAALIAGAPILLAALGELLAERAGILNLGVEGTMLVGAVSGFAGTMSSGSVWIGLALAILAGGLFGFTFAFLTVTLGMDQIVTGACLHHPWCRAVGLSR
jgi:ABC-type uncharacterized transport system permease subunit